MHRLLSALLIVACTSVGLSQPAHASASPWSALEITAIDGKTVASDQLEGRVVLLVNVASFCSYTVQYGDLQALYDRYQKDGLVVLGVPCNQFGSQEPGSNQEIKNFCSNRYGVTFPLLSKQDVNGDKRSPLYQWLVSSDVGAGKDIGWNFEKFLIGRDGKVLARFPSHVEPRDASLVAAIELALATQS